MSEQLDRKDLKIIALTEKIGKLVSQYENQVADLRAELTIVSQQAQGLSDQLNETRMPDVVQGEAEDVTDDTD